MSSTTISLQTEPLTTITSRTPLHKILRRLRRHRSAQVGFSILGFFILIAIFAGMLAPYSPTQVLTNVKPRTKPCIHFLGCPADEPQHFFGIDGNRRDMLSRILFGSRLSLEIGISTVSFAILIGAALGALSGYAGGWTDNIIMRFMDVLLAFPSLLLAIAIVAVLGPGLINALIAIAFVSIPVYARLMRASA